MFLDFLFLNMLNLTSPMGKKEMKNNGSHHLFYS